MKLIIKGDIKSGNHWYTKFSCLNKQFYMMIKNSVAEKNDDIIYYCNMHNSTINSDELYENSRKKKIPKCSTRIYYIKTEKKFYLESEHSEYYNNKAKQMYSNAADLNATINNYKNFKDELIKFLNLNSIIKCTLILKIKQQNYNIKIFVNSKFWKILSKIFIIIGEQILIYIQNLRYLIGIKL